MNRAGFIPRLDGFFFSEFLISEEERIKSVHGLYQEAIQPAILAVQPLLGSSLAFIVFEKLTTLLSGDPTPFSWEDHAYSIQDRMDYTPEPTFGLDRGLVFTMLDHYFTGVPLPRHPPRAKAGKRSQARKEALAAYLLQRSLDTALQRNIITHLTWIGVLHGIPEEAPTEAVVQIPTGQSATGETIYREMRIQLEITYPDPEAWRLNALREQWDDLRHHLDAGTPRPIALVTESSDPYDDPHRLVYGYEMTDEKAGTLYVYDPRYPAQKRLLTVDLDSGTLTEATPPDSTEPTDGPHPVAGTKIVGFFGLDYTATLPPTTLFLGLFCRLLRWKWLWRLTRRFRLRRLDRRLARHPRSKTRQAT